MAAYAAIFNYPIFLHFFYFQNFNYNNYIYPIFYLSLIELFMDQSLLPNIYDFISHTHPFSQLSTIEKDAMATSIKIVYYAKDDIIKNEDITQKGLFMIRTGSLEQINNDGSLRAKLGVGDSFGFTQLVKEGNSDYSVHFLENTLLYVISKQILDFLINKNSKIAEYFASQEWVRLSSTHNQVDTNNGSKSYNQPVQDFMNHDVVIVSESTTIQDVAKEIADKNVELAFIKRNDGIVGVVTKSDLAVRVVATGLDVHNKISSIMTLNPVCIDRSKKLFDALDFMINYNIKTIGVTHNHDLVGTIGASQLLLNSELQPLFLLKNIKKAKDFETLEKLSLQKQNVFTTLVNNEAHPKTIEYVMTRIADAFYKRIAKLLEKKMGKAPCPYAIIVAGSQARSELHLLSDQDNAIILQEKLSDSDMQYFKDFAHELCHRLDDCGYPLCTGNYMAANPEFTKPYAVWESYYTKWINNANSQSLLNSIVFMDIRFVYGDEFIVSKLKSHILNLVKENSRFLGLMAICSFSVAPPLGLFKQFVLTKDGENKDALDIKKSAINLVVELARMYALKASSNNTDTLLRLQDACKAGVLDENDLRELIEAYTFIQKVRFNHQRQSLLNNEKLSNYIQPKTLSQFERNHLKDAFRIIAKQQEAGKFRFKGTF